MTVPAPPGDPGAFTVWRRFPWNPEAAENQPFSAAFIPPTQGLGRFDLADAPAGVVYLAETAEHAVGEWLARFRRDGVAPPDLRHSGHPQALVRVTCLMARPEIADLCDPHLLAAFDFAPDSLAVRDRTTTQAVAARLHAERYTGLRWWSAFGGEWHTVALFRDRLEPGTLRFGVPEPLHLDHPALLAAAEWLGVPVTRKA